MSDYRKLKVWQVAHTLVCEVYRLTARLPSEEKFGLTSQMRRAAVSVAANIAEGVGRGGDGELARFLRISLGSATEVDYLLLLAGDLGLLDRVAVGGVRGTTSRVCRMLAALEDRIRTRVRARAGSAPLTDGTQNPRRKLSPVTH